MAAKDLVEYVAKSLVDDPDAVKVEVVVEDGAGLGSAASARCSQGRGGGSSCVAYGRPRKIGRSVLAVGGGVAGQRQILEPFRGYVPPG